MARIPYTEHETAHAVDVKPGQSVMERAVKNRGDRP